MESQREHNASNISTERNLELEVKKLKDEIERKDLQHEIEKLKLEKEIMELKSENKIQKLVHEKENLTRNNESEKLENENKKLKIENEKHKIGKKNVELKLEKEKDIEKEIEQSKLALKNLEQLKNEKENLEKSGAMREGNETFEDENKRLKEENEQLKSELKNEQLKTELHKQNLDVNTKTIPPKVITDGDRLIEGISRYIDGIEPKTNEYDSYTQWYDDLSNIMPHYQYNTVQKYVHPKYLLIQKKFTTNQINSVDFIYQTSNYKGIDNSFVFQGSLSEMMWTNENTKSVFILHPKNPEKSVELIQNGREIGDYGYRWKSKICVVFSELTNKTTDVVVNGGRGRRIHDMKEHVLVLCAIKH